MRVHGGVIDESFRVVNFDIRLLMAVLDGVINRDPPDLQQSTLKSLGDRDFDSAVSP